MPQLAGLKLWCVGSLLLSAFMVGCAPADFFEPQGPIDVEFVIISNDQPLAEATVMAIPLRSENDLGWRLSASFGSTDAQGHAWLKTETGFPGLAAGDYHVWIVEKPQKTTISDGTDRGTVRYSKHLIQVQSLTLTPRIELRHDSVRTLEGVEITSGRWASATTPNPSFESSQTPTTDSPAFLLSQQRVMP